MTNPISKEARKEVTCAEEEVPEQVISCKLFYCLCHLTVTFAFQIGQLNTSYV